MSFLGFFVTVFILLSMFDAKVTESVCQCRFEDDLVRVCKGDTIVIKPSAIRITDRIQTVKFIRNSRNGYQCNLGEIKEKSPMIKLNNIGENDTGIYRFRASAAKIYCIQLEINCEHLVVPSGSNVNLTCKVQKIEYVIKWSFSKKESTENSTTSSNGTIKDNVLDGYKPSLITLPLRQIKKRHSGNYTCIARKRVSGGATPVGHYTFVLNVYEPQLIATTKEITQESVVSVPTSMTRKETPSGLTVHTNTTKDKATEGVAKLTTLKPKETSETTSQTTKETRSETTKETLHSTKEYSAVVHKVKGETEQRASTSIGTRVSCTVSVLILNHLYIWIWKIYATTY